MSEVLIKPAQSSFLGFSPEFNFLSSEFQVSKYSFKDSLNLTRGNIPQRKYFCLD